MMQVSSRVDAKVLRYSSRFFQSCLDLTCLSLTPLGATARRTVTVRACRDKARPTFSCFAGPRARGGGRLKGACK